MSLQISRLIHLAVFLAAFAIGPRTSEAGPFLDWLFGRRPIYYPVGAPAPVTTPATATASPSCAAPIVVNPGVQANYATIPGAFTQGATTPATVAQATLAQGIPTQGTLGFGSPIANPVIAAPYYAPIRTGYASQSFIPLPRPVGTQQFGTRQFGTRQFALRPYGLQQYSYQPYGFQPYGRSFGAKGYVPSYVTAPAYQSAAFPVPVTAYRPVSTVDPTTGQTQVTLQPCTTYEWQTRQVPYNVYRPIRGLFGSTHYDVPPQALGQYSMLPQTPGSLAIPGALTTPGITSSLPGIIDSTGSIESSVAPSLSAPSAISGSLDHYPSTSGPSISGPSIPGGSSSIIPRSLLPDETTPGYGTPPMRTVEPADQRPSLKGDVQVESEGAAPSVSIRNGNRKNLRPIEVHPPDFGNSTSKQSDPIGAGFGSFPWRTSSTNEGDSTKPRTNAQPIPDPDRGNEFQSLTPPRLLDPDDRSVRNEKGRSSKVAPASWINESTEERHVARPPTESSSNNRATTSTNRRRVIGDSDFKSQ